MIRFSLILFMLFSLTACQKELKQDLRADSKVMNLTSIRWGKDDFLELSKRMSQSILKSKEIDFSNSKKYAFDKIRNDTHDHIDTKSLQNKILLALKRSKKFTFIKKEEANKDYIFQGKISSIFKKNNRSKDMFFSFTLTLTNMKTATIVWSEEIEIRKIYKKSLFSW